MSDLPSIAEILALEIAYWNAVKQKDGARTTTLSGANTLVTSGRGLNRIPRDAMGRMTEDRSWSLDAYTLENVEIIAPAANVAIIAYVMRQTMTMNGQTEERRAADSSTWIRGDAGWQCHAHSESLLDQ